MMSVTYKPKLNAQLRNALSSELIVVDIINEEEIDGKKFWVVQRNGRTLKLSKDAFALVKR
jgi:hypothetical protein